MSVLALTLSAVLLSGPDALPGPARQNPSLPAVPAVTRGETITLAPDFFAGPQAGGVEMKRSAYNALDHLQHRRVVIVRSQPAAPLVPPRIVRPVSPPPSRP